LRAKFIILSLVLIGKLKKISNSSHKY
jgi:hypothetical protein